MKDEKPVALVSVGNFGSEPRRELRSLLGLTGCEISVNTLPAGQAVPFVHAHRENEEVYLILSGWGQFWLDGTVHNLAAGDALRIAPAVERCLRSSDVEPLVYLCVQAKAGATPNVTQTDGVIVDREIHWV